MAPKTKKEAGDCHHRSQDEKRDNIQGLFDECLLTDAEMALGPEKWIETMDHLEVIRLSLDDGEPPRAGGASRSGGVAREAYRKSEEGDKAGAAGPGSAPMEFREGFGRGKPQQ